MIDVEILEIIRHDGECVTVPASDGFSVKEWFKSNERLKEVPVPFTGSNFCRHFMELREGPRPPTRLCSRELLQGCKASHLFDIFTQGVYSEGGESKEFAEKTATPISAVFSLLKQQGRAEKGPLWADADNVFFAPDASGTLRVVIISLTKMGGGGWSLGAVPMKSEYALLKPGSRIFSCI